MINLELTQNYRPSIFSGLRIFRFAQNYRIIYRKFFELRHFLLPLVFVVSVLLVFIELLQTSVFQRSGTDRIEREMYGIVEAINRKDDQTAKERLEELLQQDPENKWAIRLYSKYLDAELGRVDEEIEKTKKVVSANSDYKAAWLRLSLLYKKAGKTDLSEEANKKAIGDNF